MEVAELVAVVAESVGGGVAPLDHLGAGHGGDELEVGGLGFVPAGDQAVDRPHAPLR